VLVVVSVCSWHLFQRLDSTFAPTEDQGNFIVRVTGPEGASLAFMEEQMAALQADIMPYYERGEIRSFITMVPGWGSNGGVNGGIFLITLPGWDERPRDTQEIMDELTQKWSRVPALQINMFMRSGLARGGGGQPVQFVLGGRTYEELAQWRDLVIERAEASGLFGRLNSDFQETKPSFSITVDKVRASDLGVSIQTIGQTLQAMMSESRVTTFVNEGEEYDVVVQAEESQRASPDDLRNIYVRSDASGELIPLSNLITVTNTAGPNSLRHYNRQRAITISADLAPGVDLGSGLAFLENVVQTELPEYAQIGYKGEALVIK